MRARKQTSRTLTALLFTLTATGLSQPGQDHLVPFDLGGQHLILVSGTVRGKSIRIKIDTGATHSVLDSKAARRLGIKPVGKSANIHAFGKSRDLKRAILSHLRIGTYSIPPLPCLLGNVSFVEADMILGLDVLRRSSLTIDYENRTISFASDHRGGLPVALVPGSSRALVPVEIEGRTVVLAIDTGAPRINLFQERIESWSEELRVRGRARISTLAGRIRVRRVELDRIRFGGSLWEGQEAFLLDTPADSLADGVLGLADLKLKRIHLDFPNRRVSIVR